MIPWSKHGVVFENDCSVYCTLPSSFCMVIFCVTALKLLVFSWFNLKETVDFIICVPLMNSPSRISLLTFNWSFSWLYKYVFIFFSAWGCSKLPGSHWGLLSVMCNTLDASAKVARDRTQKALPNTLARSCYWTGTRMSGKLKVLSTSDKFSINLCTSSLSTWHEKLGICRACSRYKIYNKSHCLKVSPGSISLFPPSDLGIYVLFLGTLYSCQFHWFYFTSFLRTWGLFLSDAMKCLSLRMLAAFSVPLDPIADTLAHHLAADFSCPCVQERIVCREWK